MMLDRCSHTYVETVVVSLTSTGQRVSDHWVMNELTLVQSSLTVTMETVETNHMSVQTLEDQNHISDRHRHRQTITLEMLLL